MTEVSLDKASGQDLTSNCSLGTVDRAAFLQQTLVLNAVFTSVCKHMPGAVDSPSHGTQGADRG